MCITNTTYKPRNNFELLVTITDCGYSLACVGWHDIDVKS